MQQEKKSVIICILGIYTRSLSFSPTKKFLPHLDVKVLEDLAQRLLHEALLKIEIKTHNFANIN